MKKTLLLGAALVIASVVVAKSAAGDPPKTCATEYPKHRTSDPSDYPYDSEDAAFRVVVDEYTKVRATYKKNGRDAFYPASLVGCPICKDTSSGPQLYEKWGIR